MILRAPHRPRSAAVRGGSVVLVALAAALAFALAAPSAQSAAGGTDLPFSGSLAGSAWWEPDATCPLGFRTVSEAAGIGTHLGQTDMESAHCFVPPNMLARGEMTLVAANGDTVHMTYTGTCEPGIPSPGDRVVCDTENVVTGGTGRFANATGELDVVGYVDFVRPTGPWPASWTWSGTLSR